MNIDSVDTRNTVVHPERGNFVLIEILVEFAVT